LSEKINQSKNTTGKKYEPYPIPVPLSLPTVERHPAGKSEGEERDGCARNVMEEVKELEHGAKWFRD